MLSRNQQAYFDKTIKIDGVRHCISSPREYEFINFLTDIGFKNNVDYVHQFACTQEEMGMVAVADFAFPKEQIIIELDGQNHKYKKQKRLDEKRDKTFVANKFMVVRIKTPMSASDKLFYKYLIQDLYEERHEQYKTGRLDKGGRIFKTYREE